MMNVKTLAEGITFKITERRTNITKQNRTEQIKLFLFLYLQQSLVSLKIHKHNFNLFPMLQMKKKRICINM